MNEKQLIGYYSEEFNSLHGCAIWITSDGKEVNVTEVSSGIPLTSSYPDLEKVGPVVECIRSNKKIFPTTHCTSTLLNLV